MCGDKNVVANFTLIIIVWDITYIHTTVHTTYIHEQYIKLVTRDYNLLYKNKWNTVPSELSPKKLQIFTREEISSHLKRSPSLWLHNKARLWKQADLVFHWCLYNKQNITYSLMDMNFIFSCSTLYLNWPLKDKIHIHTWACNILYIHKPFSLMFQLSHWVIHGFGPRSYIMFLVGCWLRKFISETEKTFHDTRKSLFFILKFVDNSWRENQGNHYREGGLNMWSYLS